MEHWIEVKCVHIFFVEIMKKMYYFEILGLEDI